MYRYNTRREYALALLLLAVMLSLLIAPRVLSVEQELSYEKKALGPVTGRWRLAGWVLEHFHYDINSIGHCKDPRVCVAEMEKDGYFSGACDDVSRVFAYLYMKAGYGDPLIIIVELTQDEKVGDLYFPAGTMHSEVAFFDGDYIYVFYGLDGKIREVHFASDYLFNYLDISVQRKPEDIYLYNLVTRTGSVSTGRLDEFVKMLNRGSDKISPYLVDEDSYIHVKGRFEGSDCPILDVKTGCPLEGSDVKLKIQDVCKVYVDGLDYYVVRKFKG